MGMGNFFFKKRNGEISYLSKGMGYFLFKKRMGIYANFQIRMGKFVINAVQSLSIASKTIAVAVSLPLHALY